MNSQKEAQDKIDELLKRGFHQKESIMPSVAWQQQLMRDIRTVASDMGEETSIESIFFGFMSVTVPGAICALLLAFYLRVGTITLGPEVLALDPVVSAYASLDGGSL